MDVSGVNRSGYTPLPVFSNMAAVLAARPSMAQMSAAAAVQATAKADEVATATRSVAVGGTVDMYL